MKKKEVTTRKDIMATMAEMGYHLPNVCPSEQELVSEFMVEQLRGRLPDPPCSTLEPK